MRDYELVAIISPEVDEEGVSKIVDKVTQSIDSRGGAVEEVKKWGRRKLAYPIKHFLEGGYVLMRLQMEPLQNKALEADMKISEDIIRYLLIKLDS